MAFEDVKPHPSVVFAQNDPVSERAENRHMRNDRPIHGIPRCDDQVSASNRSGRCKPKLSLGSSDKNKTWIVLAVIYAVTDIVSDFIKVRPSEEVMVLSD